MFSFDANQHQPESDSFDLIPNGTYQAVIEAQQRKDSQNTGNAWLELTLVITGPQYAGRKVWDRLFFWPVQGHQSHDKMIESANRRMTSICKSIGIAGFRDPQELVNRPITIRIGVEKNKDPQYPDKNKVQAYLEPEIPALQQPRPQQPAQAAQPAAAPPASAGAPAWTQGR